MTTIGSSQLSQAQIDGARNTATVEAPPKVEKQQPEHKVLPPGGLSAAAGAGTVAYASPSLDGINWDAIAADLSTTDVASIQISQIMELLITTASVLRKGQREAWLADAQNALQMGLNAADRMRESAAAKLACDVLSNGVAVITAGLSMASSGATLAKSRAVTGVVEAQAKALEQAQARALQTAQQQVTEQVSQQAEHASVGTRALQQTPKWNENPLFVKPEGEGLKAGGLDGKPAGGIDAGLDEIEPFSASELEPPTGTPGAGQPGQAGQVGQPGQPGQFNSQQAAFDAKKADIELWKTQQHTKLMGPWNAKVEIFQKSLDIAGALGKTGAAIGEYFSNLKQAEAQEARARGEYAGNVGQVELDFANELRDNLKAALDSWKSVEASRHQAVQGIYNI